MKKRAIIYFFFLYVAFSCNKKALLDAVPSSNMNILTTPEDLQAVLDNEPVMNSTPLLGELSSDDYYIPENNWLSLSAKEKNAYKWSADIYGNESNIDDWEVPYQQVYYANVVLDAITNGVKFTAGNQKQLNAIKGEAYFMRAYAFFNLVQVFALGYDNSRENTDLGIAVRLSPLISVKSVRGTMKETYDQVLSDLLNARNLLPASIDHAHLNRPTLPAAMAMLARVYLSMRKYNEAGAYADSCLTFYNTLMNYNQLNINTRYPIARRNAETIYQTKFLSGTALLTGNSLRGCVIDTILLNSYAANDLRRSIFFSINGNGSANAKGSYYGTDELFTGLATDEIYLVRAECFARANNATAALADLNALLEKRWQTGTFVPVSAPSATGALQLILAERKKELVLRGLRWTDIRRLNNEGAAISLKRNIQGQNYNLPPGDKRYALPIPPDVIARTGMPQNPR